MSPETQDAPLRICLLTGEYPPDEGGVADYTRCLAEALADRGLRVDVLSGRGPAAPSPGGGVTVHRLLPSWGSTLLERVGRFVARTRPSWLHIQYQTAAFGMRPTVNALPFWLGLRSGVRSAITYHDLRVPYLFPKAGRLRDWVTRMPARSADLVVATNEADERALAAALPTDRLCLIPIGSNIPDAPPAGYDRTAWRASAGWGPETAVLAYFGFLNDSKGGRVLLQALGRLREEGRDARLVMIGGRVGASDPTNNAYLARFEADIALRGLAERVRWTGHVSPAEVSAWLRAADVVTLPYEDGASYRRGSLLAALSHGAPIVTTEPGPGGGALPALRHGDAALLVPPGAGDALAAAAARVLDEPGLAARLSRGARSLAEAFGWPAIAEAHEARYRAWLGSEAP